MPEISVLILSAPFQKYLPQESQFIEVMSNPLHYEIISMFMHTVLNQRRYL